MKTFLQNRFNALENEAIEQLKVEETKMGIVDKAFKIHTYEKCLKDLDFKRCQTILISDLGKVKFMNKRVKYKGITLNSNGRIVRKRCEDGKGPRIYFVYTPIRQLENSTEYTRPCSLWLSRLLDTDYYNCTDISLKRWMNLSHERKLFAKIH